MNASVIDNNNLSTSELETLRLTALDLTSELELDQLLEMIIRRARELLRADGGGIYLLNEQDQLLRVKYYLGEGPSMLGTTLHVGEGLVGEVVQKNEEIRVENYSEWDKRARVLDSTLYRAVIGVPLTTKKKRMGAIYMINYEEGRTFSDRDAEVLKVLASHAAIALANAAEFERHRTILRQLQLINDLNEKLRHAVDLEEILQITLEESLKAVGANEGSVMMLDENTGEIEIRAWVVKGNKTDAKGHKRFARDEGVAGYVAKTGKPYNCTDTSASPFFAPSFTKRRIKSLLSVPIILHHRVFCIINADSEDEDFFTDGDMEMLISLAGHVAIALESQLLRDIGLSLSTLPLDDLYARIVKDAATLTGSDVATIFILNESNGEIKRVALYPPTIEIEEEVVRENGLTKRILNSGKLINLSGTEFEESVHPAILRRHAKSLIAAPLNVRIGNTLKTIGVLFVTTTLAAHYDKHDEELLQSLANQAAVAIDRTRNFKELQESNSYKESLLESALDAIVGVDTDGKVLMCNPSAERILHVSEHEVLGASVKDYFLNLQDAEHIFATLADTGRIVEYDTDVKSRLGEPIPIRLSAVRLKVGGVAFFQDRRDLESARRHRDQMKQLMEAEQAITALSDEKEVYRMVVDKTVETLEADIVCLYHYDKSKERMYPRPIVAGTFRSGLNPEDAFSTPLIEKLLRIGGIYFIPTLHNNELLKGYPAPAEIMSLVSCPLIVRKQIVGFILCGYFDFQAFMDEEEKAMMSLYFNGVATAIDNAQLFQEVQQRATAMQGFYRASMLHFISSDLNQHLNSLLDQVVRVTNVESASMEIDAGLESGPIFIQHGKESELIKSKRSVKIQSGNRTVGKLTVANKQKAEFDDDDQEYLDILGATAGGIIERARLKEQASAVQSIDVAFVLLSVWNRMIKERIGSVKSLVECCGENDSATGILNELTTTLNSLTGLELGSHSVENDLTQRVDVSRLLIDTAIQARERIEVIAASVGGTKAGALGLDRIEPNCWVKGHKLLLSFAFKILIDNAVIAIEQKGLSPVHLRIECLQRQDAIEIWLSDTGPGIDPEIKSKLFKLPLASSETGSGYGCLTAGMIFKVHNGVIEIDHTDDNGTMLKITLPADK